MIDKDLLFRILEIQSYSRQCYFMQTFLWEYAEKQGWHIDSDEVDNLYITKGVSENYPCVVAHMDTVHRITKGGIEVAQFVGNPDIIFGMNPDTNRLTGIGGDDKCGIYAALHCLNVLPECKVAFFVDEEIGCVGSSQADINFFSDCRYILQADRRGNSDFVNNICGPISSDAFLNDVAPIIKKFGYKFCHGMMTDVEALRDNDVGISVANMSAGYFAPHSDNEYINLKDLDTVCNMMVEIFETMTKTYPFIYVRPKYKGRELFYGPQSGKSHSIYDESSRYQDWWENMDEQEMYDRSSMEEESPYEDMNEIYDPNDYQVNINGVTKSFASMTDAEWEKFENENWPGENEENWPRNPHLKNRTVF